MEEETLRLQFGSAATTIGTQWLALQQANESSKTPHVLAFEAKGRVRRQLRPTPQQQEDPATWGGGVQVYDQSGVEPVTGSQQDGLWSWGSLNERNLVEVDEFRLHMPLHNFYEGHAVSNGGIIGNATLEDAEDRVRAVLESCDQLRLVQGLVDMDSSWGGLAHEMMTYVAEECPGAVIVVVGNDWSYPMATDDDDAVFRVAPHVRDRTKIEGRKRINVASSVALLSEISGLLVPVAMSPSTLPSTRFSQLRVDRSNCAQVSSVVATALKLAMPGSRGRSVNEILEGFQPSMKIAELAASFPHTSDPTTLLQRISDSATAEVGRSSSSTEDPFYSSSLLPVLPQLTTRKFDDENPSFKTHYRRLHFRGAFANSPSLRHSIDRFPVSPRDITLQWSQASPLLLPDTYRLPSLAGTSIDAVSQLASSSEVGNYLSTLAQRVEKSDKRTLYEFTRAADLIRNPSSDKVKKNGPPCNKGHPKSTFRLIMFGGAVRATSRRGEGALSFSSRRSVEEDSWTEVERQELDHATSYVSESMYLVMENPAGALYMGETVHFKVHALCDQSTLGRVAGVTGNKKSSKDDDDDVMHGTLFLTSYRLLFRSFQQHHEELVEVHLNNIAELAEFRVNGKLGPMSQLEVSCKNFELVKFNFPGEAVSRDVYVKINQMLIDKLQPAAYAFARQPDTSGWAAYDPQAEFTRLGFKTPKTGAQIGGFRITHVNNSYKMSPTYPSAFVVPASVSDGELRKISFFRARGRVPAVTHRHKNDAVVARCAQPLVGLRRKRCTSDEAYMAALRRECKGKLLFIDCRSQTSAYGNIALGGGFEVLDYYKDTNIMFMGIENIHSMRDSIRKLFDLIKNEVRGNERPNWLSCLESTRWLEHVRSVLVSCSICVSKLVEGTSLMIHCSDGWDRTAQITALVKLCVDPFYRTVKGFQVLIEQEWCAFGHQFRARSGHTDTQAAYWEDDNTSPVFMQFVDAVWQLMRQFPCSFEFNERYLIALLDEAGDFRNPFYMVPLRGEASSDRSPTVLQFKWHTSSLAIWTAFYLRALESNDSRDAWAKELQVTQRELQDQLSVAHQQLQSQVEQNSDLQSELERLRRESAQLHRLLEGEVYSDTMNGVLVHEEEDDEDAVLLSVTPVGESRTTLQPSCIDGDTATPGASESKVFSTTGVGCFLGGSMSQDFEILQSYFDPKRHETRSLDPTVATGNGFNDLFPRRTVEEVVR
ncbi:hypothetical protein PHYSODRAFT_535974 [Phytophthora sojae]|uniref:Myotubularin phosphatase domain-containing protein n=1 Tax=Phytophthora sojae (strain P6497) TaxID=1094619 RepID=G5AIK5_PHYSP|nr:hypothetical protein PHYSODRAFT_535974 [Phytophthora sojae]EGZ04615.1 hypothetical protein PHYSODRAFT_535974 [Phytophthora sojae]|eukprot:XP_009539906.1 hypothetical protein PHYSODRAFT_535974 [Phytophthora sojae]